MENKIPGMYRKECPFCGKNIESLYKGQFEWNWESHIRSCEGKKEEKEKEVSK